jgi:hypothetical protein
MIDSSGTWSFQQGMQPIIPSVPVESLAIGPGEISAIDLLAIESKGYVAVNGQYVATLDLPASDARGNSAVAPPFCPGSAEWRVYRVRSSLQKEHRGRSTL